MNTNIYPEVQIYNYKITDTFNLFPLIPACTARPGLPLSPPETAFLESPYYRPQTASIADRHHPTNFHSVTYTQNDDAAFEAGSDNDHKSFLRMRVIFTVEYPAELFRFRDRGVWWKRTFCGKFGSGNDVDWLLLLLDWVFRCQQWFEWRWQRFCCDVPDSNDSSTSRRRLIYVNLCFHLYLPSH